MPYHTIQIISITIIWSENSYQFLGSRLQGWIPLAPNYSLRTHHWIAYSIPFQGNPNIVFVCVGCMLYIQCIYKYRYIHIYIYIHSIILSDPMNIPTSTLLNHVWSPFCHPFGFPCSTVPSGHRIQRHLRQLLQSGRRPDQQGIGHSLMQTLQYLDYQQHINCIYIYII